MTEIRDPREPRPPTPERSPDSARVDPQTLNKITQLIWLFVGVLESLIAIRILLKLIGANPEAGFAEFVYGVTAIFLAPFENLTPTPSAGVAVFELSSIIAMIVYALAFWGLIRLLWIALTD